MTIEFLPEPDWKELFYILSLLVVADDLEGAKRYIAKVAARPTVKYEADNRDTK